MPSSATTTSSATSPSDQRNHARLGLVTRFLPAPQLLRRQPGQLFRRQPHLAIHRPTCLAVSRCLFQEAKVNQIRAGTAPTSHHFATRGSGTARQASARSTGIPFSHSASRHAVHGTILLSRSASTQQARPLNDRPAAGQSGRGDAMLCARSRIWLSSTSEGWLRSRAWQKISMPDWRIT